MNKVWYKKNKQRHNKLHGIMKDGALNTERVNFSTGTTVWYNETITVSIKLRDKTLQNVVFVHRVIKQHLSKF